MYATNGTRNVSLDNCIDRIFNKSVGKCLPCQRGHLCVASSILEKDKAGDNRFTHLSKCRDWDNAVLVRQFWLKT